MKYIKLFELRKTHSFIGSNPKYVGGIYKFYYSDDTPGWNTVTTYIVELKEIYGDPKIITSFCYFEGVSIFPIEGDIIKDTDKLCNLREASEGEIEKYELIINAKKYNL